jgi:hypothetical protein
MLGVAKLGRLDSSTGRAGFWKKEKNDALACELPEGDFLTAIGIECEIGRFLANFEHEIVLLRLLSI